MRDCDIQSTDSAYPKATLLKISLVTSSLSRSSALFTHGNRPSSSSGREAHATVIGEKQWVILFWTESTIKQEREKKTRWRVGEKRESKSEREYR